MSESEKNHNNENQQNEGKKMNRSESIGKLAEALSKAQGEIGGAIKDSDNQFFKNKYADLSSVVAAIRAPLAAHGLAYIQLVLDREKGVAVETIILHASGEWFSCGAVFMPVSKHDAQGYGSALTYARRYGLSAAFGVAPEDDDGNAASKPNGQSQSPTKFMSESQKSEWLGKITATKNKEAAKKVYEEARKICSDIGDVASYGYLKQVLVDHAKYLDSVEA